MIEMRSHDDPEKPGMRILILGAGAVGGYIGSKLLAAGAAFGQYATQEVGQRRILIATDSIDQ